MKLNDEIIARYSSRLFEMGISLNNSHEIISFLGEENEKQRVRIMELEKDLRSARKNMILARGLTVVEPKEYRQKIKTIHATRREVFDNKVNDLLMDGYTLLETHITECNQSINYYAILTKYIEVIPNEDKA